jgi:hypothetical protein
VFSAAVLESAVAVASSGPEAEKGGDEEGRWRCFSCWPVVFSAAALESAAAVASSGRFL